MPRIKVVYVVEADPQARHGLWRLLTRPGWSFRLFGDAATTLAAVDVLVPDLVVADLELPDADGVALLATLHRRAPAIAKILLTAGEPRPGVRHALRDGIIDGVAAKPAGALLVGMAGQLLDAEPMADALALAG